MCSSRPARSGRFAISPPDVGSGFSETLLGEAIPYQVAAALIVELGTGEPTVLVVEDVHWADEATVDVLRLVARRIAAARVLIVLSYRDEALDARHPLRVMIGEVASGLALTRVPLAPLSLEAVAQLAEPYGVDAGELYRVTAGNPFFVTEVCASGNGGIPATVRDSVLARSARLSSEARTLLDAVAIVPPQVELWLLETLAGAVFDGTGGMSELGDADRGGGGLGRVPPRARTPGDRGVDRDAASAEPPSRGSCSSRRAADRPAGRGTARASRGRRGRRRRRSPLCSGSGRASRRAGCVS